MKVFILVNCLTYIMNQMTPDIVSIVIAPNEQSQAFGSLYEIKSNQRNFYKSQQQLKMLR